MIVGLNKRRLTHKSEVSANLAAIVLVIVRDYGKKGSARIMWIFQSGGKKAYLRLTYTQSPRPCYGATIIEHVHPRPEISG